MAGKTRLPPILAVAAILAGSAAAAPVAARASFEGESGRIAFVRYYPAGPAIVTINPDGSDAELLTQPASGTWVGRPEWSPGGTMIAFAKGASAQTADIWVMNDDGTKARRLTTHPAADITPAWAADPARIAFASNRSGDYEIYDMKTDGSDVRRLTRQTGSDHSPVFGPNLGGGIQFVSNHRTGTSQTDLYGMAQNGTNLHRWKTAEPGQSLRSPDTGFSTVYAIELSGAPDRIAEAFRGDYFVAEEFDVRDPAYAPEHMHGGDEFGIAFIGEVGGRTDVFVRLNGHVTNVTNTPDLDESDPSWQAIPEHPMVDRRWDRFYDEIAWLYDEGITTGCAPERYCPKAPVLRGEMASFLFRAFALEPTAEDFFDDDAGSTHEAAINAMAAAGVTTGCAPSAYCPGGVVTRAQMASFLARVLELPPSTTDHFTDDDGSTHEADINALADAGITTGCAPDLYCPEKRLLRSELAGFLYRILAD